MSFAHFLLYFKDGFVYNMVMLSSLNFFTMKFNKGKIREQSDLGPYCLQ